MERWANRLREIISGRPDQNIVQFKADIEAGLVKIGCQGTRTMSWPGQTFDVPPEEIERLYQEKLIQLEQRFKDAGQARAARSRVALLSHAHQRKDEDLVVIAPEWVIRGFMSAMMLVSEGDAGTWNEVFGLPHRKGTRVKKLRVHNRLRLKVWRRARTLHDEGR